MTAVSETAECTSEPLSRGALCGGLSFQVSLDAPSPSLHTPGEACLADSESRDKHRARFLQGAAYIKSPGSKFLPQIHLGIVCIKLCLILCGIILRLSTVYTDHLSLSTTWEQFICRSAHFPWLLCTLCPSAERSCQHF